MADTQPLGGTAIKPVGWDRSGFEAFRFSYSFFFTTKPW